VESGIMNSMAMFLALTLICLCLVYMFAITYILTRKIHVCEASQLDVLRKIRRYCKSIPRAESIPIAAVERLLDAIEYADTKIDIDKVVIDELFKLRK
jgi:hypothetical protein